MPSAIVRWMLLVLWAGALLVPEAAVAGPRARAAGQDTYLIADGSLTSPRTLTLPARQRTTVAVHNAADPSGAGLGVGQEAAIQVTVAEAGAGGVLVERVMYFRYGSSATGGTAAFGARV